MQVAKHFRHSILVPKRKVACDCRVFCFSSLFRISGLSIQKFLNKVSQLKFKIESGNFFSFDTLFCLLKQLPGELFMF